MPEPKPGEFHSSGILLGGERDTSRIDAIDRPARAIEAYRKFAARYGTPSAVFYPCCGYDASPSDVFPNVVYADARQDAVSALQKEGLDARCCDVRHFEPDMGFDLLILMNPQMPFAELQHFLKKGHLICNSYGIADEAAMHRDFGFCEELLTHTVGNYHRARQVPGGYDLFERYQPNRTRPSLSILRVAAGIRQRLGKTR